MNIIVETFNRVKPRFARYAAGGDMTPEQEKLARSAFYSGYNHAVHYMVNEVTKGTFEDGIDKIIELLNDSDTAAICDVAERLSGKAGHETNVHLN